MGACLSVCPSLSRSDALRFVALTDCKSSETNLYNQSIQQSIDVFRIQLHDYTCADFDPNHREQQVVRIAVAKYLVDVIC